MTPAKRNVDTVTGMDTMGMDTVTGTDMDMAVVVAVEVGVG
jgi:hypothetical protein